MLLIVSVGLGYAGLCENNYRESRPRSAGSLFPMVKWITGTLAGGAIDFYETQWKGAAPAQGLRVH